MGVGQRRGASGYGLCLPCYEGLTLGALNAWAYRLLNILKRAGSAGALNHWPNIVFSPYGSGTAWGRVQLRPIFTMLRGTGSSRAQYLETPPP